MIPASYLFKDLYRQSWDDAADVPTVVPPRSRYFDGLLTPIAGAISALFQRHRAPVSHYGVHAYD